MCRTLSLVFTEELHPWIRTPHVSLGRGTCIQRPSPCQYQRYDIAMYTYSARASGRNTTCGAEARNVIGLFQSPLSHHGLGTEIISRLHLPTTITTTAVTTTIINTAASTMLLLPLRLLLLLLFCCYYYYYYYY
jgi:hypothetical protein